MIRLSREDFFDQFFDFFKKNFNIKFTLGAIKHLKLYAANPNLKTRHNSLTMKKNNPKPFNIPLNVKVVLIVLALYGAIALVTYLVW